MSLLLLRILTSTIKSIIDQGISNIDNDNDNNSASFFGGLVVTLRTILITPKP